MEDLQADHGDLLLLAPVGGQLSGLAEEDVVLAILEALDVRRGWPGRRAIPCRTVLAALEDELDLARGYASQVLTDLALPWKIPVPLIEPQGNFGSCGNDPPTSPYYTEARLSPAGQIALAAERGQIALVPVGLINGNTHRQGTRPPFRPAAVIDAIRQVLARPRPPATSDPHHAGGGRGLSFRAPRQHHELEHDL